MIAQSFLVVPHLKRSIFGHFALWTVEFVYIILSVDVFQSYPTAWAPVRVVIFAIHMLPSLVLRVTYELNFLSPTCFAVSTSVVIVSGLALKSFRRVVFSEYLRAIVNSTWHIAI